MLRRSLSPSSRAFVPLVTACRHAILVVAATILAGTLGGCKKSSSKDDDDKRPPPPPLVGISVPNSPLSLKVPDGWRILVESNSALPAAPEKPPATIALTGRLLLTVREEEPTRSGLTAPRVEIFHDPWLPVGTTAADYLRAHRIDNKRAVPTIQHVEAERSRRQGRPAYLVRDEWAITLDGQGKIPDKTIVVSQESLLLVDTIDGTLHGYAVVATLLKEDRPKLERALYEIMDSIRFDN